MIISVNQKKRRLLRNLFQHQVFLTWPLSLTEINEVKQTQTKLHRDKEYHRQTQKYRNRQRRTEMDRVGRKQREADKDEQTRIHTQTKTIKNT